MFHDRIRSLHQPGLMYTTHMVNLCRHIGFKYFKTREVLNGSLICRGYFVDWRASRNSKRWFMALPLSCSSLWLMFSGMASFGCWLGFRLVKSSLKLVARALAMIRIVPWDRLIKGFKGFNEQLSEWLYIRSNRGTIDYAHSCIHVHWIPPSMTWNAQIKESWLHLPLHIIHHFGEFHKDSIEEERLDIKWCFECGLR